MSTKTLVTLPDTLWELLTLALDDLEVVEKDQDVRIDMGVWYGQTAAGSPVCAVCLAGAVLRNSLGVDPAKSSTAGSLHEILRGRATSTADFDKCMAIDRLRRGDWYDAARRTGRFEGCSKDEVSDKKEAVGMDWVVSDYIEDAAHFKSELRKLAAKLKEHNL